MQLLTPADLAPFADIEPAKAKEMIDDALSLAVLVAPCLDFDSGVELNQTQLQIVKAVLRRAVLRWHEVGTGVVTQQTSGPFSQTVDTTRSGSKSLFWPSEIADLQAVCRAAGAAPDRNGAFAVDTVPTLGANHAPTCSLYFGALRCSCGSYLNNFQGPIPEYGRG